MMRSIRHRAAIGGLDRLLIVMTIASMTIAAVRTTALVRTEGSRAPLVESGVPEAMPVAVSGRGRPFARSPFRLGRVRPRAVVAESMTVTAPPRPREALPPLRVKAIVGGPPWSATIAGLPGMPGERVVRAGDRFAAVEIVAIDTASVRVATSDTTWSLQLRRRAP